MSERDLLLHAIIHNPADSAPRLILADWLLDHDDELHEHLRKPGQWIVSQVPNQLLVETRLFWEPLNEAAEDHLVGTVTGWSERCGASINDGFSTCHNQASVHRYGRWCCWMHAARQGIEAMSQALNKLDAIPEKNGIEKPGRTEHHGPHSPNTHVDQSVPF